jgi:hypothetical protein
MSVRWLFRAVALVMDVLFFVYFVCVQINAVGYLAGKRSAIISGATPPIKIDSGTAAAADILIGLVIEVVTALVAAVATAMALTWLRDARRVKHLRRGAGRRI